MTNIDETLESIGAVLRGHFVLSSGRHSDVYFEKFRVLERPDVLADLCEKIAARAFPKRIDRVAGPLTGGILVAYEVARQLQVPGLYIENEGGRKTLRRGAKLTPGERVLVVDDVLTTGLSLGESVAAVREAGGDPILCAVLLDRWEGPTRIEPEVFAAHQVQATSFAPDEVPDWLAAIPVRKPGTRVS